VEPDVGANTFIAKSEASKKALKSAAILKSLKINVLITGESGVGKTPLAQEIAPKAPIIDAKESSFYSLLNNLSETVIIKNFQNIINLDRLSRVQKEKEIRLIALSSKETDKKFIDKVFGIKIYLPPLKRRKEDILPLSELFLKEAKKNLSVSKSDNFFTNFKPDLSNNAKSLKKSIYKHLLISNFDKEDIICILEKYFEEHLGEEDDYRSFLHLYELPLIRAGLKKYGSQLKLSKVLGLNRNTLRKKIQELEKFL